MGSDACLKLGFEALKRNTPKYDTQITVNRIFIVFSNK